MENYGFEKVNWNIQVAEIKEGYYCDIEHLAVLETQEKPQGMDCWQDIQLREPLCEYLLVFWKENEEEKFFFQSRKDNVRALEFLDYLISDFGLVKGHGQFAQGEISATILGVQMAEQELESVMRYVLKKARAYFQECECIDANTYISENADILTIMEKYQKKLVKWAFVRSLDVVKEGQQLCIKSLENESGVTLQAGEDAYIMIGCRGEIYNITKEKFESTYEATKEPLDIFEQMLDFIPVIETIPEGEYISLDEVAHLCHPKRGTGIFAKQLEKRTKVFTGRDSQVYFLGRQGDYLAVRRDDVKDIYIIQKEVFEQTYEKV